MNTCPNYRSDTTLTSISLNLSPSRNPDGPESNITPYYNNPPSPTHPSPYLTTRPSNNEPSQIHYPAVKPSFLPFILFPQPLAATPTAFTVLRTSTSPPTFVLSSLPLFPLPPSPSLILYTSLTSLTLPLYSNYSRYLYYARYSYGSYLLS